MQEKYFEEWRACPGLTGYEVSSIGRVRSWKKRTSSKKEPTEPRLLTPHQGKSGYLMVHLRPDGGNKQIGVHTLVCLAWHGERPEGAQIRHINGDKYDNTPSNLVWGTHAENTEDRLLHGDQVWGESVNTNKLSEKDVRDILGSKDSSYSLGKKYGVFTSTICRIRKGITWKRLGD